MQGSTIIYSGVQSWLFDFCHEQLNYTKLARYRWDIWYGTGAETIQERKLVKGGNSFRENGIYFKNQV